MAGSIEYFKYGLDKPPEVEASTSEWRAENDNIGRFVEECCVTGDGFSAKAAAIYAAYRQWAETSGERIVASDREFSARLISRGYQKKESNRGRHYEGLGLRLDEPI